jgi:hypothetical protein
MKLLAIIIVLTVVPGAFAQDAKLTEAARKEGKLVLYGTMQSDIFEVLQKTFQKRPGSRSITGAARRPKYWSGR